MGELGNWVQAELGVFGECGDEEKTASSEKSRGVLV